MASNDDVAVDVRRNRRRVRVRKAATNTTATSSTVNDVTAPNDNAEVEAPEVETAQQNDSTDALVSPADHVQRQLKSPPETSIKDSIDDSELTTPPRSEIPVDGEISVQPSTETDDTAVNHRSHPSLDDSPSHEAPKKSRGKRRVKNKGRKAREVNNETVTDDHRLIDHEGAGDWFTAVRNADIPTIRRLAESRAVNINSMDGVSRSNNRQQT